MIYAREVQIPPWRGPLSYVYLGAIFALHAYHRSLHDSRTNRPENARYNSETAVDVFAK